jgi:hypothetical protein
MKRNATASAMAEALDHGITLSELRQAFTQVIVLGYHDTPHGGIGKTPMEKWEEGVRHVGRMRPWPTDAAGTLRLDHLRLIDGGTRRREHGHFRFDKRNYIPFKPGMPEEVRILYDPDNPDVVALYDASGRMAGIYCGDAYASGTLHISRAPSEENEVTGGAAVTSAVVDYLTRKKPERPKAAARRQKAVDIAHTEPVLQQRKAKGEKPQPISLRRRREFAS